MINDSHQTWRTVPYLKNARLYSEDNPPRFREYQETDTPPQTLERYWDKRFEYWPNFDEGVLTDEVGLFSVTAMDSAIEIAEIADRIYPKDSSIIVDACCGVGGNTDAFARIIKGSMVVGVDMSQQRIYCAQHNCFISEGAGLCQFLLSDCIAFLNSMDKKVRFVFSDPPWGGPNYKIRKYDDFPFDVKGLAEATRKACGGELRLILFLPRDFPVEAGKEILRDGETMEYFPVRSGETRRIVACCLVYGGRGINKYRQDLRAADLDH